MNKIRIIFFKLIALLDVGIIANHFGSIVGEGYRYGWSSEDRFGFFIVTAGLIVFVLPLLNLVLFSIAFVVSRNRDSVQVPIWLSNIFERTGLLFTSLGIIFFIEGFFIGSFQWLWYLTDTISTLFLGS